MPVLKVEGTKSGIQFFVGLLFLLTILFAGLKIGGIIDWPWWAVVIPVGILPAIGLFGLGIFLVGRLVTDLGARLQGKEKTNRFEIGEAEGKVLDKFVKKGSLNG